MADAAAAVIVGQAEHPEQGLLGAAFGNDGRELEAATLAHGPGPQRLEFGSTPHQIHQAALRDMARACQGALGGLPPKQLDWFLPHQPNGPLLRDFAALLGFPEQRLWPIVEQAGSTGAASVGLSLDRLWRSGQVRPGQHLLLAAVGGGSSWGGLLWRL
jgi:3-oxoacyl-[acyl-carrier-protein] synthase III